MTNNPTKIGCIVRLVIAEELFFTLDQLTIAPSAQELSFYLFTLFFYLSMVLLAVLYIPYCT